MEILAFGRPTYPADGGNLRLYTPTREFQNWMEILRNCHEAYGLAGKRLGDNFKSGVITMAYKTKIEALNQKRNYVETLQS